MTDLSTLKPGDTVHFRCGGSAVVDFCCQQKSYNDTEYDSWGIYYKGDEKRHRKTFNKTDGSSEYAQPFDIIRIESAFRWEDVKPGMAFILPDGSVGWWIGRGLNAGGSSYGHAEVLQTKRPSSIAFDLYVRESLTRAPEHDIEVKI